MELQIVGVDQKEHFSIVWVELQTKTGNLIIQPDHAPMILELQQKSQVRFCLDNTKQKSIEIAAGIAHVTRNSVTILIQSNI